MGYNNAKLNKISKEIQRSQKAKAASRFYNINSILGNEWAMFYVIVGGRMTGKSYSLADYYCRQHKRHQDKVKNYWFRISETSTKALLENKAVKLIDPDLQRKYKMDLTRKGSMVYNRGRQFCEVMPLSQFAKLKGVGFFDKDYDGYYNITLDEFQLEIGEKRTSFDILYNFMGMLENVVRTTKSKVRVFLVGNTLEEASTILKAFNFIPQRFGRFYLKSKRCVIDNLEPTEEYLKDRQGSAADLLGGDSMSNYTNELTKDTNLLTNQRLVRPTYIIKFRKDQSAWYTVWDDKVIRRYKGESCKRVVAMRPYLDTMFSRERRINIIDLYDARAFKFKDLISQKYFEDELSKIRKL